MINQGASHQSFIVTVGVDRDLLDEPIQIAQIKAVAFRLLHPLTLRCGPPQRALARSRKDDSSLGPAPATRFRSARTQAPNRWSSFSARTAFFAMMPIMLQPMSIVPDRKRCQDTFPGPRATVRVTKSVLNVSQTLSQKSTRFHQPVGQMVGFTCGDDQASVHHALQVEWSSPWSFSVDSQGEHTVHWQVRLGRTGSFRGFLDPAAWPLFRWQFLSGAL